MTKFIIILLSLVTFSGANSFADSKETQKCKSAKKACMGDGDCIAKLSEEDGACHHHDSTHEMTGDMKDMRGMKGAKGHTDDSTDEHKH